MEYFKIESWILSRTYMVKLIHFVVTQYEIQFYLIIIYYTTFTFRKNLARKIFRRLELTPVFKDNLVRIKLSYSNVEILEFFILVIILAMMSFLASIIFNSIDNITPAVIYDLISKPLKRSISSFLPFVQLSVTFFRAKRILLFILEIVFNYIFFIALKLQRTRTFADQIEITKEYFLDFLKSINYFKFFYYTLRFQFYKAGIKILKLRYLTYYNSAPILT